MKHNTTLLLLLLSLLTACTTPRYIYAPAPPVNPFFTEKGESKVSAFYTGGDSESGKNRGFDFQGAYAIGNHWALTASYSRRFEKDIFNSGDSYEIKTKEIRYRRKQAELGVGCLVPVGIDKMFFFTLYGGYGFGRYKFEDYASNGTTSYTRMHDSHISKWYIQPAFNYTPGEMFRASITGKCSFVRYGNISTNYSNAELSDLGLDHLPGNTFSFFEPTLALQFGVPEWKWVKLDAGFTLSSDPGRFSDDLQARGICGFIGFSFDFFKLKKSTTSR